MLEVTTETAFPGGPLAAAWEDLVAADPSGTVFHTPRFLALWCRHLRRGCELRLRFVRDGDEVIGVVPEVREKDGDRGVRVVHFAGGEHVTDYRGPVSRPEHRSAVVEAWFDLLDTDDDWDEIVAGGLSEDAGWHELIAKRAESIGLTVVGPTLEDVCPRVDLREGWEGYLQRLSSKQRHEMRRKARKLAREAGAVTLVPVPPEGLDEAVDTFLALNRVLDGPKGRFFVDESMTVFFHAMAAEFGPSGTFRVHRLDVEGRPAALSVSLVHQDEWGLYNSAFEHELAPLAPGMVLIGELLRIAGEEGCAVFDLLRGDEEYKYRFGAEDRRLFQLTLTRASLSPQ